MTIPRPSARGAALDILLTVEAGGFTDEGLADLASSTLEREDQALARKIVYGTLRRRRMIDAVLEAYLRQPIDALTSLTLILLRLSVYQLRHLDRVPAYAIVSEAVDLAKQRDPQRASLVNAVLRGIADRRKLEPAPSPDDIGLTQSFPDWLIKRWVDRFGAEATLRTCEAINARQPVSIHVGPGVARQDLAESLAAEGFQTRVCGDDLLYVDHATGLFDTQTFHRGWFFAQGPGAACVVDLLNLTPGLSFLDLCSSPGGKLCAAAARLGPAPDVLAVDRSVERTSLLRSNLERLGLRIKTLAAEARSLPVHCLFDRVLVDAPCSGLGTIGRHPEIRWHRTEADLLLLPPIQRAILTAGADRVTPGGLLVYSTCTTEPEENDAVVAAFLSQNRQFRPEAEPLFRMPTCPGEDGVYAMRLRRTR